MKLAANVEIVKYKPLILREGKPKKIPEQIYSKFKPYFCDSIKK